MPKDEDESSAKPTIVGREPSAANNRTGSVPRGVEALIKKASVDPEFRKILLEKRADAAQEIDLDLTSVEAGMLNSIPKAQIDQIIDKTAVPKEHRRVFLGKVGAAMIAVLGTEVSVYASSLGLRTDTPPLPKWMSLGTNINDEKPFLNVKAGEKGPHAASVSVKYVCPFENGEIRIFFTDEHNKFGESIACGPSFVSVSKGNGEITFGGYGQGGTTQWLIVSLRSTESRCLNSIPKSFTRIFKNYKPQEYFVNGCSVWRIVKFHKEWKFKG